jgi:hypothetical protein
MYKSTLQDSVYTKIQRNIDFFKLNKNIPDFVFFIKRINHIFALDF